MVPEIELEQDVSAAEPAPGQGLGVINLVSVENSEL